MHPAFLSQYRCNKKTNECSRWSYTSHGEVFPRRGGELRHTGGLVWCLGLRNCVRVGVYAAETFILMDRLMGCDMAVYLCVESKPVQSA